MFSLSDANRFFLYPFPTDMRKSFDSLSGIVRNQMGMNVMEGDAFIFVNRFCTCMKVLHMECGGLVSKHSANPVSTLKTMKHSPKKLEFFGETCTSLEIFSEIRRRRSETVQTSPLSLRVAGRKSSRGLE